MSWFWAHFVISRIFIYCKVFRIIVTKYRNCFWFWLVANITYISFFTYSCTSRLKCYWTTIPLVSCCSDWFCITVTASCTSKCFCSWFCTGWLFCYYPRIITMTCYRNCLCITITTSCTSKCFYTCFCTSWSFSYCACVTMCMNT